ncbi:hypothetical protein KPP03845_107334 [Streptomyces xanthophaeus]|nr:hypothetical protein KPP03845_107334 [Streptomyces xanthophaeus]
MTWVGQERQAGYQPSAVRGGGTPSRTCGRLLAGAERDRDLRERNPAAETAVEFMVWSGELASTRRAGGQRVFDLAERSVPTEFLNVLGVATADDLADYLLSPPPSQPVSCPPPALPASRGSPACRPSSWILLALQAAPCRRRHPPGAHRVHLGRGHALRADHARLRPGRTATRPGHAVLGPPGGAPAHPDRAPVHCGLPPQETVDERFFSIVIGHRQPQGARRRVRRAGLVHPQHRVGVHRVGVVEHRLHAVPLSRPVVACQRGPARGRRDEPSAQQRWTVPAHGVPLGLGRILDRQRIANERAPPCAPADRVGTNRLGGTEQTPVIDKGGYWRVFLPVLEGRPE